MGKHTGIAWTDHTWNPWWGCARVSPGCEHCYAEAWAKRTGYGGKSLPLLWGAASDRRFFGAKHWDEPRKWNRAAGLSGRIERVFCASMADVFEPRRDLDDARAGVWSLITETPHLTWQLLTKRPQFVTDMIPRTWLEEWPSNLWLGVTTEDQKRADERLFRLTTLAKKHRFIAFASYEPAIEPVDFLRWKGGLDWLIIGGESGPGARRFDVRWAEQAIRHADSIHAAAFVKQLGSVWAREAGARDPHGADPAEWAPFLRVQEFPDVQH
jgi:protein gp37